jgi:predicted metal-dependent HD superfamily phosphohydrolase
MLVNRWLALCEEIGLDGRAGWALLSSAYGDPARAYHNLNHIRDCLLRLDEHAHLAVDLPAVELAIWFHDIVYDPRAADNEERSAAVAAEFLAAAPLGALVADLIRDTKHDSPPRTRDAELLCDIDLGILGRSPNKYDSYARAIREEYAWVPLPQYAEARTRMLEGFLARPAIFVLDELQELFGEQARANLTREILSLAEPLPDYPDRLEPDNGSLS